MKTVQEIKAQLNEWHSWMSAANRIALYEWRLPEFQEAASDKYDIVRAELAKVGRYFMSRQDAAHTVQAMKELITELEALGESETWQGDETRNAEGRNA